MPIGSELGVYRRPLPSKLTHKDRSALTHTQSPAIERGKEVPGTIFGGIELLLKRAQHHGIDRARLEHPDQFGPSSDDPVQERREVVRTDVRECSLRIDGPLDCGQTEPKLLEKPGMAVFA